jgi:hypothetical protein
MTVPARDPVSGDRAGRPLSAVELIVRVLWMTAQLTLVMWLAKRGAFFFYQGF